MIVQNELTKTPFPATLLSNSPSPQTDLLGALLLKQTVTNPAGIIAPKNPPHGASAKAIQNPGISGIDALAPINNNSQLQQGSNLSSLVAMAVPARDPQTYFLTPINGAIPATDSASAVTAIATGKKTDAGNIAWERNDPLNGQITTIAETLRQEKGFALGVVSTVPFSHATPAGFVSHNPNRNNYQAIATEIIRQTQPEVVIGGGHPTSYGSFKYLSAQDYTALSSGASKYTFVERTNGVNGALALQEAAARVDVNAGGKLFGLFGGAEGNFDYHQVADAPGNPSITRGSIENPTLLEAVNATLDVLSRKPEGFFAMFEQGDIDWSNHANDFENSIGGIWDLDRAVAAAEEYVQQHLDWANTLMIVTSDHSNSYMRNQQLLGSGDLPLQVGTPYNYSYPNAEIKYSTNDHTNELVTLSARGGGARLFEKYAGQFYPGTKLLDNTQIYQVMREAANAGVKNIILFIGDGMNIEHEIATSRYLYGESNQLAWQDWSQMNYGWEGFATTWDVTTYNLYATSNGAPQYDPSNFNPNIGYAPSLGGVYETIEGTPMDETLTALDGRDYFIYAGAGNDRVIGGEGNNFLDAGAGNDLVTGNGGNERIFGGAGNDTIDGQAGNDMICGDGGNDLLSGGQGNDTLRGGGDNDSLWGNGGRDTFILTSNEGTDTIHDFSLGEDKLQLIGGLSLGSLSIDGNDIARIHIRDTGELIATLIGVNATTVLNNANLVFATI